MNVQQEVLDNDPIFGALGDFTTTGITGEVQLPTIESAATPPHKDRVSNCHSSPPRVYFWGISKDNFGPLDANAEFAGSQPAGDCRVRLRTRLKKGASSGFASLVY